MSMDQEEAVGRSENQHTTVCQISSTICSANRSSARSPQLDDGELIVDK